MRTHLLSSAPWAQLEFADAPRREARHSKRCVSMGDHLAAQPGGALPQAFTEWAEWKATSRFLAEPRRSDCPWTCMADREADFYEPMQRGLNAGADFVIRAFPDRRLAGAEGLPGVLPASLPCRRWSEIQSIVGRYCARWWVQEYHQALKSGAGARGQSAREAISPRVVGGGLGRRGRALAQSQMAGARATRPSGGGEDVRGAAIKLVEKRFGPPQPGH